MSDRKPSSKPHESVNRFRHAAWCGVVCALAVVITALNALPPIEVQYRVRNQVLVTPLRLDKLKQILEHDRQAIARGQLRYAQLAKLKVLDGKGGDSILVELESLWTGKTSPVHIQAWLEKVSRSDSRQVANTEAAREARFIAWQAETAKHYLQHHRHVHAETSSDAAVATNKQKVPAKLASHNGSTSPSQSPGSSSNASEPNFELQLTDSVKKIELEQKKVKARYSETLEKFAGPLEVVGPAKITSKTSRLPGWMSMSILILGLASGTVASWLQYRLEAQGTYDPTFVANQLAIDGLPIAGTVEVTPLGAFQDRNLNSDSLRQRFFNITGKNLSRFSEGLLTLWCIAIAGRIILDPMWRSVAVESPLAALGRLFAGLP